MAQLDVFTPVSVVHTPAADLNPNRPSRIAAALADLLQKDPIAAGELKSVIGETKLLELLGIGAPVFSDRELLDEVVKRIPKGVVLEHLAKQP